MFESSPTRVPYSSHFVQLRELRLHYVEHGEGPLIILLHGFPETWVTWTRQIAVLAAAGYRVVALSMRGYGHSDQPREVSAYDVRKLAGDVEQLIEQLGESRAHVVGHDWGGIVAWYLAALHPERVSTLCTLSAPHPHHWRKMLRDPAQLRRSWYIFLFQLPWLPEFIAQFGDYNGLRRVFTNDPSRARALPPEIIEAYVAAARRGTSGTFNYYRAMGRAGGLRRAAQLPVIDCPTLTLWGQRDRALGQRYALPPRGAVRDCRSVVFDDVGHWLLADAPEAVERELLLHLRAAN